MPDITMPRLSDSMEEGTILKWLKSDGDEVAEGDELAEIETDKATMTYEADASGVLQIVAEEGQTLAIGEVIAKLKGEGEENTSSGDEEASDESQDEEPAEAEGDEEPEAEEEPSEEGDDEAAEEEGDAEPEEVEEPTAEEEEEEEEEEAEAPAAEDEQPAAEAPEREDAGEDRVIASPVARRLAKERGVDLSSLEGTGPGGRIVRADVEAAKDAPPSPRTSPAPASAEPAPPAPAATATPTLMRL